VAFEDDDQRKSDFEKWIEDKSYTEVQEEKKRRREERRARRRKKGTEDVEAAADSSEDSEHSDEKNSDADAFSEDSLHEEADISRTEDDDISDDEKPKRKRSRSKVGDVNIVKELFSLVIYIGVVIILCFFIITYVGQRTVVNGKSMEPTLHDGDNLWIDKLTYHFKDPQRYDIVVFPYQDDDVYYIKRIIGMPGETIQIDEYGNIIINGEILIEDYGNDVMYDFGIAIDPITLGDDEYFVLGDNRNDSHDSRWADVGNISRDEILGKAVFRLSPLSQFGKLD